MSYFINLAVTVFVCCCFYAQTRHDSWNNEFELKMEIREMRYQIEALRLSVLDIHDHDYVSEELLAQLEEFREAQR